MARSSFAVLLALVASISSATGFMPAPTGVAFASRRSAPASVTMGAHGKFGLFSPAVLGMKAVIGETELNKLRAKVIGEHSKVIAAFVDTHDTKFGQLALSKLFEAADAVSIYLIDHQTAAPRTLTTGRWLPDARRWHRCQYKRRRRCNDRHPTL
mmetsp:Transcript_7489/g.19074  ORF Transcript_7489/g.19074 Transcript_7489/m.19074 type:complete len:155 (+) Transcript_7489:257-721(+)